jgi:hypothetical protein
VTVVAPTAAPPTRTVPVVDPTVTRTPVPATPIRTATPVATVIRTATPPVVRTPVGALVAVTPTPATCRGDTDCDDVSDLLEQRYGSDPRNAASTPESRAYDQQSGQRTCHDRTDNDRDGRIDGDDSGC